MSVCFYRRISLNPEPIWFSFTGQIYIQVLGRFITILLEGATAPLRSTSPSNNTSGTPRGLQTSYNIVPLKSLPRYYSECSCFYTDFPACCAVLPTVPPFLPVAAVAHVRATTDVAICGPEKVINPINILKERFH